MLPMKEKKRRKHRILRFITDLNSVNKTDYSVLSGDFNARVGKQSIGKILGTNCENTLK